MTIITQVFTVMSNVFTWISSQLTSVLELFYADGSLTTLGVLAIIALGFSVFFLLMRVITNFLQFRA